MNILYLTQYFNPPQAIGGTRHYEMAKRLVAKGHTVTVITSSAFRRNLSPGMFPDNEFTLDGIQICVLDVDYHQRMTNVRRIISFILFSLRASIKRPLIRPDVVFASSTPLTIVIPALMQSWRHWIPMVFEVRDLWPTLPIAIGAIRFPLMIWIARVLERLAYTQSRHIVALSPGMKDGIMQRSIPSETITVIPNACDRDRFAPEQRTGESFKSRYPNHSHRPWIVYAGSMGRINRLEYLIDVAKHLRQINSPALVVLVGEGSERERLITLARQESLLDSFILFVSPRAKEAMPHVLHAADICCSIFAPLPAMEANSANKFFDALAANRPVFLNYGGWQADLIEEHNAGIADRQYDPAEAANRLHDLLNDNNRLSAMRTNAARLGEAEFDRDALANKLESVLVHAVQ